MNPLLKRVALLERGGAVGSGGVLVFDGERETAESALARAPNGAYLVTPRPASDVQAWQAQCITNQRRSDIEYPQWLRSHGLGW
jgi:hypothetical protein